MQRPLQIHFFVNFVHEQGTYFRFHNLARSLKLLGHEVEIFGCDHHSESKRRTEERDNILYHITPSFRGQRWFPAPHHPLNALAQLPAASKQCDVAHLFQPFLSAALAWRIARTQTRFYDWDDLWTGGLHPTKPVEGLNRYAQLSTAILEKRLPKSADHMTVCGRFLNRLAIKRGAVTPTTIPNGVWQTKPTDKEAARRALGLKSDALYLGYMGRTADELDWCLSLITQNLSRHPNLRFAVCGPPESAFVSLSPHIRERIDYLGSLPPARIPTFASAIDLGLLPLKANAFNRSRFPIKFAEYLMGGAPVLCSNVGDCAKLGENLDGVYLAGNTQELWASRAAQVISSIAAKDFAPVSRGAVSDLFGWESIGARLESSYKEALNA